MKIVDEYLKLYPSTTLDGIYLISYGLLGALVQPFREGILVLYVMGKGISLDAIRFIGFPVYVEPMTKAHERLYKRFGFSYEGKYLVWRE